MKRITACLDSLHAYRLNLPILYAMIALSLAKGSGIRIDMRTLIAVASFSCALVATYLLNRVTDRRQDIQVYPGEAVVAQKVLLFLIFAGIATIGGALLLLASNFPICGYGVYLAVGVLYSIPIGRFQIRKILFLKNIYAASAWFSSFGVILWHLKPSFNSALFARSYLYVLFMILVYELLWDIRDADTDRKAGIATIPAVWGVSAGRMTAVCLIAIAFVLSRQSLFSLLGLNMMLLVLFAVAIPTERPRLFHAPLYAQVFFSLAYLLGN